MLYSHKEVKKGEPALHAILLSHNEGSYFSYAFICFFWLDIQFLAKSNVFFSFTVTLYHTSTEVWVVCAKTGNELQSGQKESK